MTPRPIRVLILSKALLVETYQSKAEEIAKLPGIELTVAVPPYWREGQHRLMLERARTSGYTLAVLPMVFNGHYHIHFYRRLGALLDAVKPHVLHIDEEQYNLATVQALRHAVQRHIPALFFTWQNIDQRYPPPFALFERYTFRHAAHAIAGNADAGAVIRRKGYAGPLAVIPQFGVDPDLFTPGPPRTSTPFVIGFVGRLIRAKGLHVLMEALAGLAGGWELRVVGTGEARAETEELARRLDIARRVVFMGHHASAEMPAIMRGFDVLVGPSLTTARWKEQFGRMLVEAMACGVPVIGSDSGEIPNVIGDAGIVVPEGDADTLRAAIAQVRDDGTLRHRMAQQGRARVLALFTQQAIARRTYEVYAQMVESMNSNSGDE